LGLDSPVVRGFLHRLQSSLILATFAGLVILIWMASWPAAAVVLCAGGMLLYHGWRRGFFHAPRQEEEEEEPERPARSNPREAKYMVTQILRLLTRVQVTYLCQTFAGPSEGRAFLKRALPRGMRGTLDELQRDLEAERRGERVPSLELAHRVVAERPRLLAIEGALEAAKSGHPDHTLAHPLIFVVTEGIDAQRESPPDVVLVSGWNPSRPTLMPEVDAVTLLSESEGGREVKGKQAFGPLLRALVERGQAREVSPSPRVYAVEAVESTADLGLEIEKVPLGFTIGSAELSQA
jgi:hypothetical protein